MSVVLETTLGDITIDLFLKERPQASLNFLKLCKIKYFNYNLFHTISRGFIAQTGDPTGSRIGGESVFGVVEGPLKRYFEAETNPRLKHTTMGLVSFVGTNDHMIGSQFFITLGNDLTYLDEQHCVFGEVMEGLDVLELLNETICDQDNRPYQDVRITHTVILDDPFPDPESLYVPSRSPSPSAERLQGGRIAPDEEVDETQGKSMDEVNEIIAAKEAKARATILEMIGDIPDADMAPPENVLFVCKLNPVTTDDDLEIIFSRFGKIKSCEVIRDKKTAESLQYAFVEFTDRKACEDAYFKMDNVLIDDRRIHVDFSQSVAKIKWHGKGRGVTTYKDKGKNFNIDNILPKEKNNKRISKNASKFAESAPNKLHRDSNSEKYYNRNSEDDMKMKNQTYSKNYKSRNRERSHERDSRHQYSNEKYSSTYKDSKNYKNMCGTKREENNDGNCYRSSSKDKLQYYKDKYSYGDNYKGHTSVDKPSYRENYEHRQKSQYKHIDEDYDQRRTKPQHKLGSRDAKKSYRSSSADSEKSLTKKKSNSNNKSKQQQKHKDIYRKRSRDNDERESINKKSKKSKKKRYSSSSEDS